MVVVLLITMVILLSITTSISISSIKVKRSIGDEAAAYDALLSAESALNSLENRLKAIPKQAALRETLSLETLNSWLKAQGLDQLQLDDTRRASLSILQYDAATSLITVEAIGYSHNAQKRILKDMYLSRAAYDPRLGAALTSWVKVKITGNVDITGFDGQGSDGLLNLSVVDKAFTLKASSDKAIEVMVADAQLISPGDYLKINNLSYKVLAKEANELRISPLETPTADQLIYKNDPVYLIPFALRLPVPDKAGKSQQLIVSDTSAFLVGDKVYLDTYKATVQAIDYAINVLTVSWEGLVPSQDKLIKEGTAVRRDVLGVSTANQLNQTNNTQINYGSSELDHTRVPNPKGQKNLLFEQTFGLTLEEFSRLPELKTVYTTPTVISGIIYLKNDWQNGTKLCGEGILVIEGSAKINGTCDTGFRGLLYVKGEFDSAGKATFVGAVVVEGIGSSEKSETHITGTSDKNSGAKILYDPAVLAQVMNQANPWLFSSVHGSWRQK